MEIQRVPLKKIKPNPRNPRVIRDDKFRKLVTSIREFPEMLDKRPLVCYTDPTDKKLVVLGGNMRLKAAAEVGLKTIPVTIADDWTEKQRNEFLIKDNVSFGEWDWESLANEWDTEPLGNWGLDVPVMPTGGEPEAGGDVEIGDGGKKLTGDPFDDESIDYKNQYGVIVICPDENAQADVFKRLTGEGYTCKIVVT